MGAVTQKTNEEKLKLGKIALFFYNTLTRKKELFLPLKKNRIGLYTCGPTVYNYAHLGNLRAYVFEDLLKRALLFNKFKVNHVMNITDVGHLASDADEGEDKMTKGLRREGLPLTLAGMRKLAAKFTKAFIADLRKLNILLPDCQPKASQHIAEDLKFIAILQKKEIAYQTSDGIYFDTSKVRDYGKLAGTNLGIDKENVGSGENNSGGTEKSEEESKENEEESKDGKDREERFARIQHNPEKRNRQDFALWKFSSALGWAAPLGKGFPGWHIECSVMASKYLGKQFDIHCGGREHIPVHHTNELAQSEAAWGKKPWVKYWLHHEWLTLASGEKMAKSGENFLTLSAMEKEGYQPLDFRYFCLGTHYRHPLMFSYEALEGAKIARRRLLEKIKEFKAEKNEELKKKEELKKQFLKKFVFAVNDDLNTPQALAVVWELVKDETLPGNEKYSLLLKYDEVLGLDLKKVKEEKIPSEIIKLAKERLQARQNKEWKKADELRLKIKELGYIIGDTKEGFEVRRI